MDITDGFILLIFIFPIVSKGEQSIYFCLKDQFTPSSIKVPEIFMKSNESNKFSVKVQDINCLNFEANSISSNASAPAFYFYPKGDILVPDQDYLLQEEYCVSRFQNDQIQIKYCDVKNAVKLIKCCPPHQVVDFEAILNRKGSLCVTPEQDVKWRPTFYDAPEGCGVRSKYLPYHFKPVPHGEATFQFIPYKHVTLKGKRHSGSRFRLMRDGHLLGQSSKDTWIKIKQGEFCIDGMALRDDLGQLIYSGELHEQIFFDIMSNVNNDTDFYDYSTLGNDTDLSDYITWDNGTEIFMDFNSSDNATDYLHKEMAKERFDVEYFYITLLLIGATFLLAISVLNLLIWEKHNIHGWTIFAYVTTMLFMFMFLATSRLLSVYEDSDFGGTSSCRNIGILAHFFYLSTMCWLTIINVDLWLTFRNVKPTSGRRQNFTRFALYSAFAIGCPVLIVLFAVILDSIYLNGIGNGSECVPPFILPIYGDEKCYMQEGAYWPWLYIPIALLLGSNVVTFSTTVYSLLMYRRNTRNAISTNAHQRDSVILFGKLFVVAGISWIFELISNTVKLEDGWSIWVVFDCYNLLQAVLIFIIFAMKRENIVYLYQKYECSRGLLRPILQCCYSRSFDPERTDMTGLSFERTSKFHFRKTSSASTVAVLSTRLSTGSDSGVRRGSASSAENYA